MKAVTWNDPIYARRLAAQDLARGYAVCDCERYAHVFRAAVLKRLPKDYRGELCKQCNQWMCDVRFLRQ